MRNKTFVFLALGPIFGCMATPAFAVDPATMLTGGGAIGYVLIFLSVVGVALVIEHIMNVRREKVAPPDLIDEIEQLLNEEQYQEALELCESEPNFLTNVMAAALPKLEHGYDSMEQAAHDISDEESIKLHAKVSWLSLLAGIAPMMGLLGTVWGMIGAFETIADEVAPEPRDFAADISVALITTVLGLIVAIPLMVGFFYFRNKVTRIVLEISAISEDLMDRFRHHGA